MGIAAIVSGLLLSWLSLLFRYLWFPERKFGLRCCRFRVCVGLSLVSNAVALWGFHQLVVHPTATIADHHDVLEILGLLSAGAIAGFWGIEYENAADDESLLLNVISGLFVLVFFGLFFSISFYIGASKEFQNTPALVSWAISGIMGLLLEINAVIDIWDYRNPRGNKPRCVQKEE